MIRALLPILILSAVSGAATLTVLNGTRGWVLTGVYVRVSGSDGQWGDNLLGEGGIIGLTGRWSTRLDAGVYDIRVEDTDGDGYVRRSVAMENDFLWKVTLSDMNDPATATDANYGWSG
jgi:hypothetical protein